MLRGTTPPPKWPGRGVAGGGRDAALALDGGERRAQGRERVPELRRLRGASAAAAAVLGRGVRRCRPGRPVRFIWTN